MHLLHGCKLVQKNANLMRSSMEISPKPNGNLAFGKVFGNIADKQLVHSDENNAM